jgi:uncharacterized membrane protein YgcG
MTHHHALRLTALGAVIGALAVAAAPAGAKTLHGTVVHKNKSQRSFVLAARSGKLTVINARTSPAISRVVDVKVGRARGGASVARNIRARGRARHARLHGRVSFRGAHAFAVSSGGTSILVHDNATPPPVGSTVTTDVTINNNGELESDDVQEQGNANQNPSAMKIEGAIQAIDTTARTLTLFADDNQEEDSATATTPTVTVHVPAAADITQFAVGDKVELIVVPQADGSFLLQSVEEIDNQAEDNGNDQGQNGVGQGNGDTGDSSSPGNSGGGDNGGSGGGGD